MEVEEVSRYSATTFHWCVNCGLSSGFQARTLPLGL
jgi:hypothetical protein